MGTALLYIFMLVGFFFAFNLIKKFNQGTIQIVQNAYQGTGGLKPLADALGFQHEKYQPAQKADIYNQGEKIWGDYKGFPVTIIFEMIAKERHSFGKYGYEYTQKQEIIFDLPQASTLNLTIIPKMQGIPATGNGDFDAKFSLQGDTSLNTDLLTEVAQLEWVNLNLKGHQLRLIDNYYDQFGKMKLSLLNQVHPIWGTSASNVNVDVAKVKKVLDVMVSLAQKA